MKNSIDSIFDIDRPQHIVYCKLCEMHAIQFLKENFKMKKKGDTRKVSRDAGTGRFVKKSYADKNPKTTVTETMKYKPKNQ